MDRTDPDFSRYVEACNYPAPLDVPAVEIALRRYLVALGVQREVVRIERGWTLERMPDLRRWIESIMADFRQRRAARAAGG